MSAAHHVSSVLVSNTEDERRLIEQIKARYQLEERAFHLFSWYMGYRLVLAIHLRRTPSKVLPSFLEVQEFVNRH
jgi:hypothetical protein